MEVFLFVYLWFFWDISWGEIHEIIEIVTSTDILKVIMMV